MNQRKQIDFLSKTTLIVIAIGPILYYNQIENVPLKAFILGTGSWGIGLIFKMITHQLIVVRLSDRSFPQIIVSFTNGFLSGLFELGATVAVILLVKDKFVFDYKAIISFGLAIGSFESLIVALNFNNNLMKGTALEKTTEAMERRLEKVKGIKLFIYQFIFPVAERILCIFLHISTRGLIFVSFLSKTIFPIPIALLVFIIADGILGYYFQISGKLLTDKGFAKLYVNLFILTAIVTTTFFILILPYKNSAL